MNDEDAIFCALAVAAVQAAFFAIAYGLVCRAAREPLRPERPPSPELTAPGDEWLYEESQRTDRPLPARARVAAAGCASIAAVTFLQAAFGIFYIVYVPLYDDDRLGLGAGGALIAAPFLLLFLGLAILGCQALARAALAIMRRRTERLRAARRAKTWLLAGTLPIQALWVVIMVALSLGYREQVAAWASLVSLTSVVTSLVIGVALRQTATRSSPPA